MQDNIVSEAEQGPLLRKLDAIAACIRVKLIIELESNDSEKTDFTESNGNISNGNRSNRSNNNESENKKKEIDSTNCAKPNDMNDKENEKNFVKEEVGKQFIKGTEISTEEIDTEDK